MPRRQWIARHKGEERAAAYEVDPGPLRWLVDMVHDAGGVSVIMGGMGVVYRGLGWPEIVAWIEGAQLHEVRPFWRREVMRLSGVMAQAMNEAPKGEAPHQPD